MPRKQKQQVKVNSVPSLEGVLQEVYNEACANIRDAQAMIAELSTNTTPEDVDDHTKIAKAKTDAIKEKTSSIKVKLEIAKLQSDMLKHGGDIKANLADKSGSEVKLDDFSAVRKLIFNRANNVDNPEGENV